MSVILKVNSPLLGFKKNVGSNLRKKRGYAWEDTLVKRFRSAGWKAVRLGSPSIHLPDVIAVKDDTIVAVEAKSVSIDSVSVPREKVKNTTGFVDMFTAYKKRIAVLAVKFMAKKHMAKGRYRPRELREFYLLMPEGEYDALQVTYEGKLYLIKEGKKVEWRADFWPPPWIKAVS